jgi:hypothetical protein
MLDHAASFLDVPAPGVAISFPGCSEYAFMYSHHTKRYKIIATCCELSRKSTPPGVTSPAEGDKEASLIYMLPGSYALTS